MQGRFHLSVFRDVCKGDIWRLQLHSTAITLILLVSICFLDAASLGSPCSLLDSSCFNASRCTQGFTFYIEPTKGMYNFNTLSTTAAISPMAATQGSLQHRCQRILTNQTSGEDNVETWAAECLVFVIREYFEVSLESGAVNPPMRVVSCKVAIALRDAAFCSCWQASH